MAIFTSFALFLLHWIYFAHQELFFLGLLNGALLFLFDAEEEAKFRKKFYFVLGVASFVPLAAYFLIPRFAQLAKSEIEPSQLFLNLWIVSAVVSWVATIWWLRIGVHQVERLKRKLTKRSALERNKKTDIRTISEHLPSNKKRFDPLKYINLKKGVFCGLDEFDKPIYMGHGDWNTRHCLLSGMTRSGKGVLAQILGWQSIRMGELFVVLDPKVDSWMPHIYQKACEQSGKNYVLLDLRQSAHEQINLFQGCDEETIENMLIGAFGLAEKGTDADHYRLGDRKAARRCAAYVARNPGTTAADLLKLFGAEWLYADKANPHAAADFAAMLAEMAELRAVNRREGGIDLSELAQTGGCLYVLGDMLNPRIIRMQRMLLVRLMMLAKNRDTFGEKPRNIRIFADEFRVHISRAFITSLGMSAGWQLLSLLALQSFEDLRDCPADLDPEMVKGAVMENCAVKQSYRIMDHDTAERLAASTGEIMVDSELRQVEKNIVLLETIGDRKISQKERYLIDTNMIHSLAMPDAEKGTIGCGVLIGVGKLAQFCFTSPVQVERSKAALTPTIEPPVGTASATKDELETLPDLDAP